MDLDIGSWPDQTAFAASEWLSSRLTSRRIVVRMMKISPAPRRPHDAATSLRPARVFGGVFGVPCDVSERCASHRSTRLALARCASERRAVANSTRRASMLPCRRPRAVAPLLGRDFDRDEVAESAACSSLRATSLSDAPRTARRASRSLDAHLNAARSRDRDAARPHRSLCHEAGQQAVAADEPCGRPASRASLRARSRTSGR